MYIIKRQFAHDGDGPSHDGMNIWYSPTAYVVKWSVLLALFVTFFLWITIGYYHARKRVKAGLPPLAYHRWLVPRSQRYPLPPPQQNNLGFYAPNNYGMHEIDPPPAYSTADMPPIYQLSHNGNKIEEPRSNQQLSTQQTPIEIPERSRTNG